MAVKGLCFLLPYIYVDYIAYTCEPVSDIKYCKCSSYVQGLCPKGIFCYHTDGPITEGA